MGKKLYVGSLPFEFTEDQLQALFAPFGQVTSANLIRDKYSGQSRGFGFVEMASDAEAQEAIAKLNGNAVGNRKIIVNEARPKEDRPRGDGWGNQRGGGRDSRGGGYRGGRSQRGFRS